MIFKTLLFVLNFETTSAVFLSERFPSSALLRTVQNHSVQLNTAWLNTTQLSTTQYSAQKLLQLLLYAIWHNHFKTNFYSVDSALTQ